MTPEEFAVPRHKKKMRLTEFWMLIDRSRQNSGNINEVAVRLKAEEIINFAKAGDNWEGLDYCATEVYKRKTGKKFIPGFSVFKESPSGREWTEDDFQVLYPRIWAWLKQNSFQHDL